MTSKVEVLLEANDEFEEAIAWYEGCQRGLGERFRTAVLDAFSVIERMGASFAVTFDDVRGYSVKRFPYVVYYFIENETPYVIGVFHNHRNPSLVRQRR